MDFCNTTAAAAAKTLGTDLNSGLTEPQARAVCEKNGENIIRHKKKDSFIMRFFLQFKDFMVITLIIAAIISFFTAYFEADGSYIDSVIILGIVFLNAIVGVIQESKAEHALEKLKSLSAPESTVLRGGKAEKIPTSQVVVGDIILLNAGDCVPADARLIESVELSTDESALTGEAMGVAKEHRCVLDEKTPLAEQKNMVFSSSTVLTGHAKAIVTATGMDSQIGKIAAMLGGEATPQTPLQIRLEKLSKILGIGAIGICGIIFVMGVFQKNSLMNSFMLAVSLAVAAIPEGLPAVVTIVLSSGVGRMAKNRAIVRRLTAVEALGSATYICSDKTGTLTQNKMTVSRLCSPLGETDFDSNEAKELLGYAALCCNASADSGEPTEKAIVAAAEKAKAKIQATRLSEIPFNSRDKMMSVTVKIGEETKIIIKGAPEKILPLCNNSGNAAYLCNSMAEEGLRVLAVAADSRLLGLIAIEDPERREAKAAVSTCKQAGITPIMITGDNPKTAQAIAKRIGIADESTEVVSGSALDEMSDEELGRRLKKARVFARVTPEHKVRIVKALRAAGEVTAMTGDGVNDAPALKAADIGCAMGKNGTEVAKGAADIVLADDNFATIVKAVREGRGIYDNIKKVVHFLLSSNVGEIMLVFVAGLMNLPSPMLPIQLLWTNLVTDSLPGMALGVEKIDKDIMKRRPLHPKANLFDFGGWLDIALEGMLIGSFALLGFVLSEHFWGIACARTVCFCVLSLSELVHAFNCRSRLSLFKVGVFSNIKLSLSFLICAALQIAVCSVPWLCEVFNTVPLGTAQWLLVAALSIAILPIVELTKTLKFDKRRSSGYNSSR